METTTQKTNWFGDLARRADEVRKWESANPELAKAWNEANEERRERYLADEERKAVEARAQKVRSEAPKRLVNLGAPQRAVEAWEAGLRDTEAVRYVNAFLEAGKTFCVLSGGAGAGKTVAAVHGMAARLLRDLRETPPAIFVRASECARLGLYDSEDKALTRQMHGAGLLVVDDLGAEFMAENGVWRGLLDELVDVRYGGAAPTILTTNLSPDAFRARYGERVADRIRHAGAFKGCGDASLREKGKG